MWFFRKSILEYLVITNMAYTERINFIKSNKSRIIKEIKKLNEEDIIKYLFNSKLPKEVKEIITEEINILSNNTDDISKQKINKIISCFKEMNNYNSRYIISNTCPKVLKKIIITELYGSELYDLVKKGSVSKKIKKNVIDLCLDRRQLIKLLKRDIPLDLKEYIINNSFKSNYDIASVINESNLDLSLKKKHISVNINDNNFFRVLDSVFDEYYELVLEIKGKEFEDYVNKLNYRNLLKELNDFKTPKKLVDYILKYKLDILNKAVDKASLDTLKDAIFRERSVTLVETIFQRRAKDVYKVINSLYEFQILGWLNLKYLPMEYKEYIINKRSRFLDKAINNASGNDIDNCLRKSSYVPNDIKELIIFRCKDKMFKYLGSYDEKEICDTIRYRDYIVSFKKILIKERININNIFILLGDRYLDKETLLLTLEVKEDLLTEILSRYEADKLFKLDISVLSRNVCESILRNNLSLIRNKIKDLDEDILYKYLDDVKVYDSVKFVILEEFGIDSDNINNILNLISMYDTKLILDNYDDVKQFVIDSNINFSSFLQYGSGSSKYSGWLDNILHIMLEDNRDDYYKCSNYFFTNYYDLSNENEVFIINSFLEFLDGYTKYKDLFMDIVNNNIKLSREDKGNIDFLIKLGITNDSVPKTLIDLEKFKLNVYKNYLDRIKNSNNLYKLQEIFNEVLFRDAVNILSYIGGTGALRTLKKDNINSSTICELIDEIMVCSKIVEMVNDTNNIEGLRNVLIYIFSDNKLLTKIQNMYSDLEKKIVRLYELDSNNNLSKISDARNLGCLSEELSHKYGGEVFDLSDKNYCLYAHILSNKENIVDMLDGVSTGDSNFISVSPVSYRGQKYYWDRDDVVIAYDYLPRGNFICSSISNMGTNYSIKRNSSEVKEINRIQRGVLETSAVVERNAEALLYRSGLRPCGLILPGGRFPSNRELEIHQKYGLPFIVTQELHKAIDDPKFVFINNLEMKEKQTDTKELEVIIDMLQPNVVINKENEVYTGREIAIFADCHSMYEPTLAVLEDIRRKGIKEIYSLGDNVGLGPNPTEVMDLLEEYGVVSVSGNAEYYNTIGADAFPYLTDARLENQLWTERKLGQVRIKNLKLYPASIDLEIGKRKFALCHFSNDVRWDFRDRNVYSYVSGGNTNPEQFRYTNSEENIRKITNCIVSNKDNISIIRGYVDAKDNPIFGGKLVTEYDCILQGHYHFEVDDKLDDTHILTLRALSMGFVDDELENQACYYILKERKDGDVDMQKMYVSFNRNALLSSIHTCDLPSKDRVLSHIKKTR